MLVYEYIGEFNIILGPLDYIEILLWMLVCIVFIYIGYQFILKAKDAEMFIFAGLFFFLTVGARIIRLIAKFVIGQEYGVINFVGIQLVLSFFFIMFTYLGLFFYYLYLERDSLKKSHHFFSIMVIINIIITILNYFFPELIIILVIVFLIAILGLPSCYIYIAKITSGSTRRRSLMMMGGLLLIIFGITLDAPTPSRLYVNIAFMPEFAMFGAPALQILGAIIYTFILRRK